MNFTRVTYFNYSSVLVPFLQWPRAEILLNSTGMTWKASQIPQPDLTDDVLLNISFSKAWQKAGIPSFAA